MVFPLDYVLAQSGAGCPAYDKRLRFSKSGAGCPAYEVSDRRSRLRGLLEDYHLSCAGIIACGQAVEVNAACYGLTQFVLSVPVDSLRLTLVDRSSPMSNVEGADNPTVPVIDDQGDESIFR